MPKLFSYSLLGKVITILAFTMSLAISFDANAVKPIQVLQPSLGSSTDSMSTAPPRDTKGTSKNTRNEEIYSGSLVHKIAVKKSDEQFKRILSEIKYTSKIEYKNFVILSVNNLDYKKINKSISARITVKDELNLINLQGFKIDTTKQPPTISPDLKMKKISEKQLYLIQFAGPIKPSWQKIIQENSLIVNFLPPNNLLIWISSKELKLLVKHKGLEDSIQWVGKFHPAYKLKKGLNTDGDEQVTLNIHLVTHKDLEMSIKRITELVQKVPLPASKLGNYTYTRVTTKRSEIKVLARLNDVFFIEEFVPGVALGEKQAMISAQRTTFTAANGDPSNTALCGETNQCEIPLDPATNGYLAWFNTKFDMIAEPTKFDSFSVDIADTGIDGGQITDTDLHPDFLLGGTGTTSRISAATNYGGTVSPMPHDFTGHGTMVASIVSGFNNNSTNISSAAVAANNVDTDDAGFHFGLGILPYARIVNSRIFTETAAPVWDNGGPADSTGTHVVSSGYIITPQLNATQLSNNAVISNHSWGTPTASPAYDSDSVLFDQHIYDTDNDSTNGLQPGMTIVAAAGNYGFSGVYLFDTLAGKAATAKNSIVVGGTENNEPNTGDHPAGIPGTSDIPPSVFCTGQYYHAGNDANDMYFESSRGPTSDGRFKPDLVAPAGRVYGAVPQSTQYETFANANNDLVVAGSANHCRWPYFQRSTPQQELYRRDRGTSYSAPVVSGAAALLRQWFIDKNVDLPSDPSATDTQLALENSNLTPPSPAMTKAWLMNTTNYLTSPQANDDLPSNVQGMGRLDINRALDEQPRLVRDQLVNITAAADTYNISGQIANDGDFRVTLVWTDPAGSSMTPDSVKKLVNNLDLNVTIGGMTYGGNNFSGAISQVGGPAIGTKCDDATAHDCYNNVESVWRPSQTANTPFTITIDASDVGELVTASQNFALVIYNATFQSPLTNSLGTVSEDSTSNDLTAAALSNTPLDSASLNIIPPVSTTAGAVSIVGGQLLFDASGFDALGPDGPTGSATITYNVTDGFGARVTAMADVTVTGINDAPTGIPIINGTPTENQILSIDTSSINDPDGLGPFSFQWLRNGADIALNGTANTYTPVDADVGTNISIRVSYTDGGGTLESITSFTTPAIANVNDPATGTPIISGTVTEDQLLTANTAGINDDDGLGSFNFQWERNGVDIAGATSNTYMLTDADVGATITVNVSFIDGGGFMESLTSAATGAVMNINDLPMGLPTISGSVTRGQILTANTAGISDVDGLGAFNFQWRRDGAPIAVATSNTYLLAVADVGAVITVTVSYTDGHGTPESLTSNATAPVTNFNNPPVGLPTISGTVTEDQILTANTAAMSDADGLGPFSFQWLRDGANIAGAINNTYQLDDPDVGTMISVTVSYTDGGGTGENVTSAATSAVLNINDVPTGMPSIDGIATEDQILTANNTTINDADGLGAFSHQWLRNGVAIAGATNNSYTLGDLDVSAMISVTVSFTDGGGNLESITSAEVGPVININDLPLSADSFINIAEGAAASHTFNQTEFPFTFDADGDSLTQIRISNISMPAGSSLQVSAVNVANGDIIAVAQIANLVFTPAAGALAINNYASFNFEVHDGTGFSTPANLMTINIIPSAAHDPLDVVIVADTSGSMNSASAGSGLPTSKIELLKLSVNNFIDQWSLLSVPDDRIGLVLFSSNPEPYTDLGSIMVEGNDANMQAIGNHVCDLDPLNIDTCDRTGSGGTAMGGGIQEAINALRAADPDENNNQNIIVFTDGMQNRNPLVVQTAADVDGDTYEIAGDVNKLGNYNDNELPKNLRIHTIGTGVVNTTTWQTLLAGISSETSVSPTNPASHAFHMDATSDLPADWIDTLITALNTNTLQKIAHEQGLISQDNTFVAHGFSLNKTAKRVNFSVMWIGEQKQDALKIILRKGRQVITVSPKNRNIQIIRKNSHTIASAIFPVKADDGTMITAEGDWSMLIKADTKQDLSYNMWVIADDDGIKYEFIPPRSVLAVGERLPIQIRLLNKKKPLRNAVTATVSIASPRISEGTFLSTNQVDLKKLKEFVVPNRPELTLAEKKGYYLLNNKRLAKEYLTPVKRTVKLYDDGDFKNHGDKEAGDGIFSALSPVIKVPGVYRMRLRIKLNQEKSENIERVFNASALLTFKDVSKKNSKLTITRIDHPRATHKIVFTPIDKFGNYMGPGHVDNIKTNFPKGAVIGKVTDNIDGSYTFLVRNRWFDRTNIGIKIGDIQFNPSVPAKLFQWRK